MNFGLIKQIKLPLDVRASGLASLADNNNNHNHIKISSFRSQMNALGLFLLKKQGL